MLFHQYWTQITWHVAILTKSNTFPYTSSLYSAREATLDVSKGGKYFCISESGVTRKQVTGSSLHNMELRVEQPLDRLWACMYAYKHCHKYRIRVIFCIQDNCLREQFAG